MFSYKNVFTYFAFLDLRLLRIVYPIYVKLASNQFPIVLKGCSKIYELSIPKSFLLGGMSKLNP